MQFWTKLEWLESLTLKTKDSFSPYSFRSHMAKECWSWKRWKCPLCSSTPNLSFLYCVYNEFIYVKLNLRQPLRCMLCKDGCCRKWIICAMTTIRVHFYRYHAMLKKIVQKNLGMLNTFTTFSPFSLLRKRVHAAEGRRICPSYEL